MRSIVRGKEVKNVEFGAKCNNILVDGISFIEKLSFNAFNEGTRLQHCIKMHKRLFGVPVKKEKDFVRAELARVRATAMEGSFGTQKEHCSLRRVKARRLVTKILYIFFGFHAANVAHLAERLIERLVEKAA